MVIGVREWAHAMRAELDVIPTRRGRLRWTVGALVALARLAAPELGALLVLLCLLAAVPIGARLVYPVAREGDPVWIPLVALNLAVAGAGLWAALTRRPLAALVFLALVSVTFGLAATSSPPVGPLFDAYARAANDPGWLDHSWELRVQNGAFAVLVATVYAWVVVTRRGRPAARR